MKNTFFFLCLALLFFAVYSCGEATEPIGMNAESDVVKEAPTKAIFNLLPVEQTGVNFINTITETPAFNYFNWLYIYNGAGVGVGDLNGDGLADLYFTGNQVPNKLYLNLGGLKFRDVTSQAGVAGGNWSSGVTMADVNGDGLLDIYVVRGGPYFENPEDRANLLYLNNGPGPDGVPSFTEAGAKWRCNDLGFGTHATFFDYDRDGDLDLYLVNYPYQIGALIDFKLPRHFDPQVFESDRLLRNEGDHFSDATISSGIARYAFGLSATTGDFNGDGYPDIYVANDFTEPDFMFINQKDGTFKDMIKEMAPHISNFGMGCDVGDFNNDGLPDIVVLDMMAENNRRKKTNMSGMDIGAFHQNVANGFHYQYMQNTLLMNQGTNLLENEKGVNIFSDVAQLAGVSTTDWSWAPLLADFDNDGWQDLFVSNGYRRDARDNDFNKKLEKMGIASSIENFQQTLGWMPEEKLPNYLFHNNGTRPGEYLPTFTKVTTEWGMGQLTWSNGAAYADLDNDGDLDMVVNNIQDLAFIYENRSQELKHHHWLRVKLKGSGQNTAGLGATVEIWQEDKLSQWRQVTPSRGYQSSVQPEVHFGLGERDKVEAIYVQWPDGKWQSVQNPPVDQILEISYQPDGKEPPRKSSEPLFKKEDKVVNYWNKREKEYDDFKDEILLPHKMSQLGPKPALSPPTKAGWHWLYLGGSAGNHGMAYEENQWGNFEARKPSFMQKARESEEVAALYFDANGDGFSDLYIVNGSNEFPMGDARYQDHLYLSESCCNFGSEGKLPAMPTSGSVATAADVDGDGDQDLFVGGRQVPGKYPYPARSYLLENDGKGNFTDVTSAKAPGLVSPGMVTDAIWTDIDGDMDPDLVISGEWMPVSIFRNDGGKFTDITNESGLANHTGWWFSISAADVDKDGDMDLVAGNMGLNTKFPASIEHPFEIYCYDFDRSGSLDIVLGYHSEGQVFPVRGRTCTSQQMPDIKENFPTYQQFAISSLRDIYGNLLDSALHYQATTLATTVFINEGGKFSAVPLPNDAQISAVNAIALRDFDSDGNLDILLAGNMHNTEVETSRADASIGLYLKGDGKGGFSSIPGRVSGFFAPGDVKGMVVVDREDSFTIVVTRNNDSPLTWTVKRKTAPNGLPGT
jgi:hypothetical protein